LGEHRFAALQDQRTPGPELLTPLLAAVRDEQRAGRLVFDDFGALWWELLESQPSIARALGLRYPIVIADEHQDASGLQDALVRRLGTQRLVVLADHMQLIHGFRGADIERLRAHWRDSGATHELKSPHRWRGRNAAGAWLLACRERLQGRQATGTRPSGARVINFDGAHGIGGALFKMKTVIPKLFGTGHRTVAVLVADNQDLARVRNYLANNGMHPRQLGGPKDFEEARDDIEQLPLLTDPRSVVLHAYERLLALVPSVPKPVADQVKRRLKPAGPNLTGAKDAAARLLNAFGPIYAQGAAGYFQAMDAALIACRDLGYHLPRRDAARTIQETAAALAPDCELEQAVATYSKRIAESGHRAAETYQHGLLVMTVHQSKGKEFDAVVLGPLDQRRWPDSDANRRLLYVGLTRATASWTLIVPSSDASPLLALLP
jgi:DNA helicase-2/ATP-dependent DNA helicase PcrA